MLLMQLEQGQWQKPANGYTRTTHSHILEYLPPTFTHAHTVAVLLLLLLH